MRDPSQTPIAVRVLVLACALTLPWAGASCAEKTRSLNVSTLNIPVESPDAYDLLFDSAQDILRRNRFSLDRLDRRMGVVTTMPVTSQSVLEPWRHDVDTSSDLWEATLNPIRRWVEVSFVRAEDSATVTIEIMVHKERLSSPERQFNSSGAAYQFFRENLPAVGSITGMTVDRDTWMDLGRDPAMESYLLSRIVERASEQGAVTVPAESSAS